MDKEAQIQFIKDLTGGVAEALIDRVERGDIPETWDGHELRLLIANRFRGEITPTMKDGRSSRVRDFNNFVAINAI